ncbi:unnamed protein product [Gongylonema pulchrum]|uniref:LAM_G_DOMAIN domain-containing protein n=1 Tax=Gongylonema pulchrum TaxID=637853 RepID=A0A183EQC9_9BILA|nr:unnamed protein product [Gongylonema pulchrum]
MHLQPRSTNDQLLAFVASDYSPKKANYLALAIRSGKFAHLYNSGDGSIEAESAEIVKPNEHYLLDLKKFGQRTELRVNGKKVPVRGKLAPFMAGTNLFIGGIAPGIVVNPRIGGASPFSGCISKVDSFIIPFFYVLALSLQSVIIVVPCKRNFGFTVFTVTTYIVLLCVKCTNPAL